MSSFTKKRVLVAVSSVAVLATAVAAFAFWTGAGSGSGSGTVGTPQTLVLSGTVAPGIAPGVSKTVTLKATNSSASPVTLGTVHLDSVTADAGHPACNTEDFTMSDVVENEIVAAGAIDYTLANSGTLVFANTVVNQDACKGATLTLGLSGS